jgi:hypothetical protein
MVRPDHDHVARLNRLYMIFPKTGFPIFGIMLWDDA